MSDYVVRGRISNSTGKPAGNDIIYVQAVDSDQQLYEDHDDDVIATVKTKGDGSFEIPFDKKAFQDDRGWLEGNPDLYLIVRNQAGQVIHKTEIRRGVRSDDAVSLTFDIVLDSLEKPVSPDPDPYDQNNNRVLAAFAAIGDYLELRTEDTLRNFALFSSSINGWTRYTHELTWKSIGYDGPQVPRYPWKQDHTHKLAWEEKEKNNNKEGGNI
jgi:hypothetical protein